MLVTIVEGMWAQSHAPGATSAPHHIRVLQSGIWFTGAFDIIGQAPPGGLPPRFSTDGDGGHSGVKRCCCQFRVSDNVREQ
eukprot:14043235-Alexandrium_andersonii.AAC.1